MPQLDPSRVALTIPELALHLGGISEGQIVSIDGFMGSGKTNLSFEFAAHLNGFRVGLDSYVDRDIAASDYLEKLKLRHLARDLNNLQMRFSCVVVEGIRVLEALERAGCIASTRVYVKRLSSVGIWHDGLHLSDFEDGSNVPEDWLPRDVLTYHVRHRPHLNAHVIYERHEA
jgi:hypothetical protein